MEFEKKAPSFLTVTEMPNNKFQQLRQSLVYAHQVFAPLLLQMHVSLNPLLFSDYILRNTNNVGWIPDIKPSALLTGPPGTGKTTVTKACADSWTRDNKTTAYFVEVQNVRSRYEGQSSENISVAFDFARYLSQKHTVFLFFDEVDSMAPSRNNEQEHGTIKDMVNTMIKKMDRLDSARIFTLGATNLVKNLDHAFKRRFGLVLNFSRPSEYYRSELFKHFLAGWGFHDNAIHVFAKRTDRYTQDDIKTIVSTAIRNAFSEGKRLEPRDVIESIKNVKPTGDYE